MSATTRVYQHLKRAILEQVHPGGTLLTEAEIGDAVGVSRTPVREALLRLESEGLVTLYPKRGALVRPVSAQEIDDVIEARTLVEVHAAGRVWPRRDALVAELAPLLDAMRASRDAGDPIELMTADRAFHAAVVDAAGNRLLADLYRRLRDRQMRMGVASFRVAPDRMDQAVAEHEALFTALLAAPDDTALLAAPDDTALLAASDDDAARRWVDLVGAHIATAAEHLRGLR